MLLRDELPTRLVPIEQREASYARNRPRAERPAWPKVGDQVYYRRNEWDVDEDLWLMRVVDVQDPDDKTSEWAPNLWQQIRDNLSGAPLLDPAGGLLYAPMPDPWPWVHLRYEGDIPKGSESAWLANVQMTWESRIRGSAGWLPLDYRETRPVQLPGSLVMQPLPEPTWRSVSAPPRPRQE